MHLIKNQFNTYQFVALRKQDLHNGGMRLNEKALSTGNQKNKTYTIRKEEMMPCREKKKRKCGLKQPSNFYVYIKCLGFHFLLFTKQPSNFIF